MALIMVMKLNDNGYLVFMKIKKNIEKISLCMLA